MRRLTFIILCLEGAILSFNVAATAALVPSIAKDFFIPEFIAGRIVWLYMLPYGVAALIYGPLVRVFDAKTVEIGCFSLFSVANLLASLSKNIISLSIARFLMGVFGASVIPLVLILIAQLSESKERGKLVGTFFSATFIASLMGLFLSGIVPWRMIFLIPAIAGFILLFIMYFFLPSFKPKEAPVKIPYLTAFKNKSLLCIFIYIFFISLFYHGIQQWLSVYFSTEFKLKQFVISMLITLTSLSGVFGEAMGGWFSDILGRLKTVNIGIIFMTISVFLLIFKMPLFILSIIMLIWGLGWTFNHAGVSTILTDLPKEFLNEAASLNSSVRFISGGLGVALGGVIMEKSFNLSFLIFGVSLSLLALLSRKLLANKGI